MTVDELVKKINTEPESIDFTEVINAIEKACHYTPTRFHNGTGSKAATNEASCIIFAFGKLHNVGAL